MSQVAATAGRRVPTGSVTRGQRETVASLDADVRLFQGGRLVSFRAARRPRATGRKRVAAETIPFAVQIKASFDALHAFQSLLGDLAQRSPLRFEIPDTDGSGLFNQRGGGRRHARAGLAEPLARRRPQPHRWPSRQRAVSQRDKRAEEEQADERQLQPDGQTQLESLEDHHEEPRSLGDPKLPRHGA
jgi:hypothetical protein